MSERRRQIQRPDGTVSEAVIVDIVKITGAPTVVELADGSRVNLRISLDEVCRIEGEWGPNGEPQYEATIQASMRFDVPPELHKPEGNDVN